MPPIVPDAAKPPAKYRHGNPFKFAMLCLASASASFMLISFGISGKICADDGGGYTRFMTARKPAPLKTPNTNPAVRCPPLCCRKSFPFMRLLTLPSVINVMSYDPYLSQRCSVVSTYIHTTRWRNRGWQLVVTRRPYEGPLSQPRMAHMSISWRSPSYVPDHLREETYHKPRPAAVTGSAKGRTSMRAKKAPTGILPNWKPQKYPTGTLMICTDRLSVGTSQGPI